MKILVKKFLFINLFFLLFPLGVSAQSMASNELIYNGAPECIHNGKGIDYPIGPKQKYKNISDINWSQLKAGDSVRIFYRPEPYREKIIISTSGTEQQPIRICGVKGKNGERPIIDGKMARNNKNDKFAYSDYAPMQGLAIILLYNRDYETKVKNIIIEGLHIRNGRKPFSYIGVDNGKYIYENGAACIRVQAGDNIIIRDNELENCANGIFTMSQGYNEASLSRNILIEGNYLHSNGQKDSYYEHNLYIQAIGATYQFNHFGANIDGSLGVSLKERVAGSVIRYNWFDSGSTRILDLVEVEDAPNWYIEQEYINSLNGKEPDQNRLEKVRRAEKLYRKTYIYGNIINHIGSKTPARNLIHYGFDNDPALARKGTLYFYNNSVLLRSDRDDAWRIVLFDIYPYNEDNLIGAEEKIEAFNNIFYLSSEREGKEASYFCFGRDSGIINLGRNLVSKNYQQEETATECYPYQLKPTINGLENLVLTEQLPFSKEKFIPNNIALIDNLRPLPKELSEYMPDLQYVAHLKGKKRKSLNYFGAAEK